MKTQSISNQKFTGKVNIIGEFPTRGERKSINKVWQEMKSLVENQDFDLYIKKTAQGETIVGTEKNSGYPVINDNFLKSAKLAVRYKLKGPFMERKIKAIQKAIEENNL